MTLYQRCIWNIATLMRKGYWCEANSNHLYNPFSFLPSSVVDDLISCVIQVSSPGSLKVTDLYNLLTSGRVENFKLDDILISIEDLVAILMSLSTSCQNVRSLTFRNVICSDPHYSESYNSKIFKEEKALECLLRISPQLESLESCISFDLKVIRNCERLKILKLNFTRTKPLYDFLEEVDGHFWPNNTLRVFEIFEDVRNPVPYLDLVPILQYCTELTHVNANISRSLEFLHNEELYKGSLTAQYKLQKCILGSTLIDNGAATLLSLHIATLTCPEMREVDVLVNDNEAIYALSDFKNLSSLLIQWELPSGGDFQLGVQLMLERIGANLKIFHLLNFYNVDIAVIATMCPLLEVLKLEIHSEYRGYECPPVCFQHLKCLHVELMELDIGCHEDTLIMLLSHCVNLTNLHIEGAQNLNDRNLSHILAKNHLSSVKEAILFDCNLSEVGIRNLVSHLSSLEFFHFSSSQIGFEDAAHIVHEIHPHVIFVADEGF